MERNGTEWNVPSLAERARARTWDVPSYSSRSGVNTSIAGELPPAIWLGPGWSVPVLP